MNDTCELCDMREPLAEILKALDKLSGIGPKHIREHISAAHSYLEHADWALENHELDCTVPKWDGPDTVEEARL